VAVFAFLLEKISHHFPATPKNHDEDGDIEASGKGVELTTSSTCININSNSNSNSKSSRGVLLSPSSIEEMIDSRVEERVQLLKLSSPLPLPGNTWESFDKYAKCMDIETKMKIRGILAANKANVAEVFVSSSHEEKEILLKQLTGANANLNDAGDDVVPF